MTAGILILVLSVGMALGVLAQLRSGEHPATTLPGTPFTVVSLGVMAALWVAKKRTLTALASRTLASDVVCTKTYMQL